MTITTHTRHAGLAELATLLHAQEARKVDVVASPNSMRMADGLLYVHGAEQEITLDGVTNVEGVYRPTDVFNETIATRLNIPTAYLKRLHAERPDLYDANVNGILHGGGGSPGTDRNFMVRAFRGDDGQVGVARAVMSDSYKIMDNFDVLVATLQGLRDAGVFGQVRTADLSERRMVVRVVAPKIQALAPDLLRGYRSPFTGAEGADNPIVYAGFRLSNSETGGGAFTLTPEITVQVCNNGMTLTKEAMRHVHLGSRLEAGSVRWSNDTQDRNADLIAAKTRDAVKAFLSPGFLNEAIAGITAEAVKPVADPVKTVTRVAKELSFSDEHRVGILDHFVKCGQMTAGGVMHAITSYSQTVEDADQAFAMDSQALQAMSLV